MRFFPSFFNSDNTRKLDVRTTNIEAAKAVADAVRTSLGPRGMDKMVRKREGNGSVFPALSEWAGRRAASCFPTSPFHHPQVTQPNGDVIITNDGATILNTMAVSQPAAKMLVELAKAQDAAAGDGTTTVTVVCGALLAAAAKLLRRGMHPTAISDGFAAAADAALAAVDGLGRPVDVNDRAELARAAATSLASKVVSQHASLLAPMAVDAVLAVRDPERPDAVDLRDVRVGEWWKGKGGKAKKRAINHQKN